MRLHGQKGEFVMTNKISTVALRAKARKKGCRITVKGGMAQLLEYNSNVDGWLAGDNYWGVPHIRGLTKRCGACLRSECSSG